MNLEMRPIQEKVPVVSVEEIKEKAAALLQKYENEDLRVLGAVEDNRNPYTDGSAIEDFLTDVPKERLQRYWGHGITKGPLVEQLAALLTIAEKGLVVGSTGPMLNSPLTAYTHGSALALSKPDESLMIRKEGKPVLTRIESTSGTRDAWQADIGVIVLDSVFYPLSEELRAMYPNANIIKANQLPSWLAEQELPEQDI